MSPRLYAKPWLEVMMQGWMQSVLFLMNEC
jgi:hypothetical protein